jgi:transcriptional regulator with XRE-family HTH domain
MPSHVRRRGTRDFYYADSGEVFEWVHQAISRGDIADPFVKKLPVAEARPRVQKALERMPVSRTHIARMVGVTRGQLESYWREDNDLKFIPRDAVIKLEQLAREGLPELKRHVPKKGAPTLAETKKAVADAGGNLTHAERILRERGYTVGITASNLSAIAKRYKIPVRALRVVEPSKDELVAALKDHSYLLEPTAAHFGFSVSPLRRLIDKYDLGYLIEAHGHGRITKGDLREAAEAAKFNTNEAAGLLEIHPSHFRSLLKRNRILKWFDREHAKRVKGAKAEERKSLRAEILRAAKEGVSREGLAKTLDMPRTRLESRVDILGLKKEYATISYGREFVGGRERDIAPTETRVPFWMAALRDLRARYPGRGGGRKLARALGYGNATISNWLSGKRVPGLPQIERIVSEAGHPMPDWRAGLERLVADTGSQAAASRALGVRSIANTLAGRVYPSEKLLERILGDRFWVTARVQPETGARPGVKMGEVPAGVAKTQLAAAMARLLGTVRSQRELAGLLGVSPASVSRFMRAKVAVPPPGARDAIVSLYRERFGEDPPGIQPQRSSREALERALELFPTQTALAEELGLTRGHLSRIVTGKVAFSPRVHARLETLLRDLEQPGLRRANPPRFDVRSPTQGLRAIQHPVITENYKRALRVKPKHKKAVLVPCAGTKPFPEAPSHKHGYLKGLKGKDLDVYVVSEPLGVVPYSWSRKYPQESYDFPPRHLKGHGRDLLVDRIAAWFCAVAPKYKKVYLALPAHHRRLVLHALEQLDYPPTEIKDVGLGACLKSGACPPGNVRPTTGAYRKFLRRRANPPFRGDPEAFHRAYDEGYFHDPMPGYSVEHGAPPGRCPLCAGMSWEAWESGSEELPGLCAGHLWFMDPPYVENPGPDERLRELARSVRGDPEAMRRAAREAARQGNFQVIYDVLLTEAMEIGDRRLADDVANAYWHARWAWPDPPPNPPGRAAWTTNPCLPCAITALGALGAAGYVLNEDSH